MNIIKPPQTLVIQQRPAIFLAGSIAMGKAELWQTQVETIFQHESGTLLNPRRNEWDASWEQASTFKPFREQVEWELDAQEQADLIMMYFDPTTQAPITLLELGLFAATGKLIVCCPSGFWRKGNVDIVCQRYGIPSAPDFTDLIKQTHQWILHYHKCEQCLSED